MPVDYAKISTENTIKYGTEVGVYGPTLLANQYAERTHFILELIQNTEDALGRGGEGNNNRRLTFLVSEDGLSVRHYGHPFDEEDIVGICGIAQSTKKLTDIGHFGIGFKSVYAYTDYPEVHSGGEHFVITDYVHPRAATARPTEPGETLTYLPFKEDLPSAQGEICTALKELDPLTLLFLRHINEITWEAPNGSSGWIRREDIVMSGLNIRTVRKGCGDSTQEALQFLVCDREVSHDDTPAGRVEIAFPRGRDQDKKFTLFRAQVSKWASFFPTEIDTHLGFLVQGPYRTTPARDNIPLHEEWNQYLIRETASLVADSLARLRDAGMLNLRALDCIIPRSGTPTEQLRKFAPVHDAVREALSTQPLLPTDGGHIAGQYARISDPPAVKKLLGKKRLRQLVEDGNTTEWLVDDITSNVRHSANVLEYLREEATVDVITPEWLVRHLNHEFLEHQPDSWVQRLYIFLNERPALTERAKRLPIIRIENGSHILPFDGDGKPLAYLPGKTATDYPIIKAAVCNSKDAKAFLERISLRVPDLVDDIVDNVLPKYRKPPSRLTQASYQADILRIANAYADSTREQRERLISEASSLRLVYAMDCGTKERYFVSPSEAYLATDSLKALFRDVPGVLVADYTKRALRNERVVQLFRALGASDTLVQEVVEPSLDWEEKRTLRQESRWRDGGLTSETSVEDFSLRGLEGVLICMRELLQEQAALRAAALWNQLRVYARNNGEVGFHGVYRWFYYSSRSQRFPATLIRTLNEIAWIPDDEGNLCKPQEIPFSATVWPDNELLRGFIKFAPEPTGELVPPGELSAGFRDELAALKERGITEEQIRAVLNAQFGEENTQDAVVGTATPEKTGSHSGTPHPGSGGIKSMSPTIVQIPPRPPSPGGATPKDVITKTTSPAPSEPPVRVELDDDDDNPEGLSHEERDALEDSGIAKILEQEPALKRTPKNNAGYDLYTLDENENPIKVVEVKSMSGSLNDRPATMTRTQFHAAVDQGENYWLYVVEYAGDPEKSRIRKIQNPANRVRRFSFGRGWFEDS